MYRVIRAFACSLLVISATTALAAPQDQSVFDSFENIIPNTTPGSPFDLGSLPEKATFSGNAFAGVVGQGVLYNTGVRSWMVLENSVGRVDFDLNAAAVEFFARTHPTADGNTVISAFDDGGTMIGTPVILTPNDGWTSVSLSGSIDYLLVDNQATNIMNGVDDFGFTAIPEPASGLLIAAGVSLVLVMRRRS